MDELARLRHEIDDLMRDHQAQRDGVLRRLDAQFRALGIDPGQLPPAAGGSLSSMRRRAERALAAYLPPHTVRELLAPADPLQAEADALQADAGPLRNAQAQTSSTSRGVRWRVVGSGV